MIRFDRNSEILIHCFHLSEVHRMSSEVGIPGIVRDGVVVPQTNHRIPEGTHVEIRLDPGEIPPTLKAEIEAWVLAP